MGPIELLVIPRFEANANTLFDFLNEYVENERLGMARWLHFTGRTDIRGMRPGHYDNSATLLLPRCRLLLHTATPENWLLRLFESTGSEAYVKGIRERVRSLPGTWEPGEAIRVRSKMGIVVLLVLVVAGIMLAIGKDSPRPLWIRISGVAPFLSTKQMGGWRVEVPKPEGKSDAVVYWSVWIQETNAAVASTQTITAHEDFNDLFNWPISQTESGIVQSVGPKIESNKVYRAIGAFSEPALPWRVWLYRSPLRPVLRVIPEPPRRFATSEWVQVRYSQAIRASQGALQNQQSIAR